VGDALGLLTLRIQLPADRDYVGSLTVLDQVGERIAGPIRVAARASDEIAAEHGNPTRATTLPYGDPPCGSYKYMGRARTGECTKFRSDLFGQLDALVLTGAGGNAALADANGRFEILIHGGPLAQGGGLRAGSGHFRISDPDLTILTEILDRASRVVCVCEERPTFDDAEAVSDVSVSHDCTSEVAPFRWRGPSALACSEDLVAYGEYTTPQPPPNNTVFGGTASCEVRMPDGTIKSCSETVGMTYTKDQARMEANLGLKETVSKSGGVEVSGSATFKWSW
jgi:hypothetical protein